MRIIFIGSSSFGLRALNGISQLRGASIVGVITNPESFKISYSPTLVRNVLHADFVSWADSMGVPCYVMAGNMNEPGLEDWLISTHPDLIVVVGWYHMIPSKLRKIAPAIGLHASLLPDYSGGAPLVWAIINGEKTTGITLFQISDGVDNGAIFGQETANIEDADTIGTLLKKIEILGCALLKDKLLHIFNLTPLIQDESKRRFFPQRSPADGIIEWRHSSKTIYDFIRAQTKPYPGAFTFFQQRKIAIWSAKVADSLTSGTPGTFWPSSSGVIVICGHQTSLEISYLHDDNASSDQYAVQWFKTNFSAVDQFLCFTGGRTQMLNSTPDMSMLEFRNRA